MARTALLVGINHYDHFEDLTCCTNDAEDMHRILLRNGDRSKNFGCHLLSSNDEKPVTFDVLREKVDFLLKQTKQRDDLLFYFSGHGLITDQDCYLATQDASPDLPGYAMSELINAANAAGVGSVTIILDCCHSGALGQVDGQDEVIIGEGVTMITSSSEKQLSEEGFEHSLFTELLLSALEGGAADLRGRVTAAAVYGYIEQSLGEWQQRPMYRSNAYALEPIRKCTPMVTDTQLFELTQIFNGTLAKHQLAPSYEHTEEKHAIPEHVEIFNLLKAFRDAGLVRTVDGRDLYFTALASGKVELTALGKFYWKLVKDERF